MLNEQPWDERIELGLRITDELGSNWVSLAGNDFLDRLELAIELTLELAEDWAVIYCYCGQAAQPVDISELVAVLDLDAAIVAHCLDRLQAEHLVETVGPGTYRLRPRDV